jgi:hypothetical protein
MWASLLTLVSSGFLVGVGHIEPKSTLDVQRRGSDVFEDWTDRNIPLNVGDRLRVSRGSVRLRQPNGVIQTWVFAKLFVGGSAPFQTVRDERRFRVVYRLSREELALRAQLRRFDVALTKGNEFFLYPDSVLVPPEFFHVVTVKDEGPQISVTLAKGTQVICQGSLRRIAKQVYTSEGAQLALEKVRSDSAIEVSVSLNRADAPVVFKLAPHSVQLVPPSVQMSSSATTHDFELALFYLQNGFVGLYRVQQEKLGKVGIELR